MKILRTKIKILCIFLALQFVWMPVSEAITGSWSDILTAGNEFISSGKSASDGTINNVDLKNTIGSIYNLLFSLGIVMSVIIGAIIGVKLMFGGIEEKAKIKEKIVPYIIGCVIIFGAFGIWKIAINLLSPIS